VLRAATGLAEAAGVKAGARIRLQKTIPKGGGLGGGSSDAARTLVLLDRLWRTRASSSDLFALALGLGSDVPFFLLGGTALGFGRGEKLVAVRDLPATPLVLVFPGFEIPTAEAYAAFDQEAQAAARPAPRVEWDFARLWNWEPGYERGWVNDLEPPVFGKWPRLAELKARLLASGSRHALLSGSGSSLFGLYAGGQEAVRAAGELCAAGIDARPCRTVDRAMLATSGCS